MCASIAEEWIEDWYSEECCLLPKGSAIAPTAPKAATPAAPPLVAAPCLTKEYLDNGTVMFRDNCTGDWAQRIGGPTTKVATPAARVGIDKPCLTREYLGDGSVMFRDNCTGEWAQRTGEQTQR
jgi:hypothetical protein